MDRLSTQILYAVTGIVLARLLSPEDFGLVGAALVFQSFASLLVDSGFSYALLQRQHPTKLDYSTVLWFNLAVSVVLYCVLFLCAPWIADLFGGDRRLAGVSRVLFLALILNAATIVQTNRLTKAMEVRGVALSNAVGLAAGGAAGIVLALTGAGVWAIVCQTLTSAAIRAVVLWTATRWRPLMRFSWPSLRSFFNLGSRMMFTSFLNTVFLNIYSFFIGNRVGLGALGYYTQSDKWSKMGVTALSQVLTSSFVPALSAVQDQPARFRQMCSRMTRFTAYVLFPAMVWLAVMAEPVFHALFGTKWDPSILLFRILLVRGIFMVLMSLSTNFMLAQGRGTAIVRLEIVRDVAALAALALTFPYMCLATADNPVYGIAVMLYGQLAATVVACMATVWMALRGSARELWRYVRDLSPYLALTALTVVPMMLVAPLFESPWLQMATELIVALIVYVGVSSLLGSRIQKDAWAYVRGNLR